MRRKTLWVWIMCIILLVCSLSACSLFSNRKSGETAQMPSTQEPAPTAAVRSDAVSDEIEDTSAQDQAEPSAPNQEIDIENQTDTSAAVEPNADVELPEIEIPVAPSDTGKPDNKGTDIHEPVSTPENSTPPATGPTESSPPPQEPEAQPDPANSDIVIDQNGDILLPEVP